MKKTASSQLAVLLAVLPLLTHAPTARADGEDVPGLLLRAFELRRAHRNEEALAVYERAFALSPTAAVRAQRGLAEQALGHWLPAESDLDLALASDDPWVSRERASLEQARAVVREHLAWLTVNVDATGADIQLDGQSLPQGSATRVVAGVGVLEVRAPGRIPEFRRVSLAPAEHVEQNVTLASLVPAPAPALPPPTVASEEPSPAPASPAVEPSPVPPPPERSALPLLPMALGVAGVAGIGTGAYFAVRTSQDKGTVASLCPDGCSRANLAAGTQAYQDAQTSASAATVTICAGVALVAGAGVLWFLQRRNGARPARSALEVVPALGAGVNGLVVRGSL